jgi:hypothetical protein
MVSIPQKPKRKRAHCHRTFIKEMEAKVQAGALSMRDMEHVKRSDAVQEMADETIAYVALTAARKGKRVCLG